jgi:D-alanyl-D-alanine carboxypeptidase (penicillin-binding protein 5/6)
VPKGVAGKLKPVLQRKDPLVAPLPLGSQVGTVNMVADGKPLVTLPVLSLEQVDQAGFIGRGWDTLRMMIK